MLVPASSQDVGAEVHLHLDLSALDLPSSVAKSREHGTEEVWESMDNTEIGTQFLEPEPVLSTSREFPPPQSLIPQTMVQHMDPGTPLPVLLP